MENRPTMEDGHEQENKVESLNTPKFGKVLTSMNDVTPTMGRIEPDTTEQDSRPVIFNVRNHAKPEKGPDGINMNYSPMQRMPIEGDEIVYFRQEHEKSPFAAKWCLKEEWEVAQV